MEEKQYRPKNVKHFTLIVAGDNPEEMVKEYDINKKEDAYVVYRLEDAEKLRDTYIEMLKSPGYREQFHDDELIEMEIEELKNQSPSEFFADLTEGMEIDNDGNAISRKNKNGKFVGCEIGKNFSMPLVSKYGRETWQEFKSDIDFSKIHLNNQDVYKRAWEMVMEGSKPENEEEKRIYENMKNRVNYFQYYKDKDTYVTCNTAFWGYAFLSKETGWVEMEESTPQIEWVSSFYDRFIKPLSGATLLTVFECTRYE